MVANLYRDARFILDVYLNISQFLCHPARLYQDWLVSPEYHKPGSSEPQKSQNAVQSRALRKSGTPCHISSVHTCALCPSQVPAQHRLSGDQSEASDNQNRPMRRRDELPALRLRVRCQFRYNLHQTRLPGCQAQQRKGEKMVYKISTRKMRW